MKKLDTFAGQGEIKRREVSWTLTKKLDIFAGPGENKRREVVLDAQVSPKEIKSREVELGSESWTTLCFSCCSTAVLRTLSLWLCSTQQLKQQLCGTLVATQWRGDTALTFWLFRRRSTASLPPFPLSPSLISHLASVDVKQKVYSLFRITCDVSALNLLESREQRYIKAISK